MYNEKRLRKAVRKEIRTSLVKKPTITEANIITKIIDWVADQFQKTIDKNLAKRLSRDKGIQNFISRGEQWHQKDEKNLDRIKKIIDRY